jgi:hypothetical protein
MVIQFDETRPDRQVMTDPYVMAPILLLLVAAVNAAGVHALVVRAVPTPRAGFVVEAARLEDAALPTLSLRVMPWLPASDVAVRRLAEQIGAVLELEGKRGAIFLAD